MKVMTKDEVNIEKATKEALDSFDPLARNVKLFQILNGYKIIPNFSPDCIKYLLQNWQTKSSDVIVASFPKTGTNWTVEITRRLLYRNSSLFDVTKNLPLSLSFLEAGSPSKFKLIERFGLKRRLFFTHLPAELLNIEQICKSKTKVIYVLRNPKDQIVSWYHFYRQLPKAQNEPLRSMIFSGWDHFFDNFVSGKFSLHSKPEEWYPEHILSWNKYRENNNVYFLFYEDMKENLSLQIKNLANFLETPLTCKELDHISSLCEIENMKNANDPSSGQLAEMHSIILRKGDTGGWRNYLTEKQSKIIDDIFDEKLKGTNINFKY